VDWIALAQECLVVGSHECGDKPSGSMKGGEFFE
jgi:hypothetical protein